MKKILKIFTITIIFCILFLPLKMWADTELNGISDSIHLTLEKSPYIITGDLTLSPGQRIEIDKGVGILFYDNADLCFGSGECLRGDWLYTEGLFGVVVTFLDDISFYVAKGETYLSYEAKLSTEGSAIEKQKNISLGVLNLSSNIFKVETRKNGEDVIYEFVIKINDVYLEEEKNMENNGINEEIITEEAAEEKEVEIKEKEIEFLSDKIIEAEDAFSFSENQAGKIFLQIEENGEAWYVYPKDNKRYYLGRPQEAFNVMSKLSLGVSHVFIESYTVYPEEVLGMILLDVDDGGKAYYINPQNKKAYYLGRPMDAFNIMRNLGVGITNSDLTKINVGGEL